MHRQTDSLHLLEAALPLIHHTQLHSTTHTHKHALCRHTHTHTHVGSVIISTSSVFGIGPNVKMEGVMVMAVCGEGGQTNRNKVSVMRRGTKARANRRDRERGRLILRLFRRNDPQREYIVTWYRSNLFTWCYRVYSSEMLQYILQLFVDYLWGV